MKYKGIIIIIILININLFRLNSQTDTLFWFVIPEISSNNSNFDRPVYLRLFSYNQPATVKITQPAGANLPEQTINLNVNDSYMLNLTPWIDSLENKPANQILNKGIKISSTAPISVYYEVVSTCNCNMDIFALKGQHAIGNEFYIPSQDQSMNVVTFNPVPKHSIDIVATENNTNIQIIPSKDIVGNSAGVPFNINMHRGQTFCIEALNPSASEHLEETVIISDKPIAITLKDDEMDGVPFGGFCRDMGGDQLIPNDKGGKKFIAIKGYLTGMQDQIYIVSLENNNTITINGSIISTINANEQIRWGGWGGYNTAYIEATGKILLLQQSGFGCELGLGILPKIECTGSHSIKFYRTNNDSLYLNILVPTGAEGNFLINNSNYINSSLFSDVPFTNGQWKYLRINLPASIFPANSVIDIINTNRAFHLGVIQGSPDVGGKFGYFSSFSDIDLNTTVNPYIYCLGDTLSISVINSPDYQYSWYHNNVLINTTDHQYTITDLSVSDTGWYVVEVLTLENCIVRDSVHINLYKPEFSLAISDTICILSDTLFLTSNIMMSDSSYWVQWVGPFGFSSFSEDTVLFPVNENMLGYYYLHIYLNNNSSCSFKDSVEFKHLVYPYNYDVKDTALNCLVNELFINIPYDKYSNYLWFDHSNDTVVTISSTGLYYYEVSNQCGLYVDSFKVNIDTSSIFIPELPNVISLNQDNLNDKYVIQNLNLLNDFHVLIFNRWGILIYENKNDPNHFWDGTYNNHAVTDGVYFVVMYYKGCDNIQKELKSFLHVFR